VKNKLYLSLSTLTLGAALALSGCNGGSPAALTESPAQTFTVGALDTFKFDPPALTAQVGEEVTVILDNKGVLDHNFVIEEFNVHLGPITGGSKSAPSIFTPTTAGAYVYYCDVPGHREAGMTGTLTVNP